MSQTRKSITTPRRDVFKAYLPVAQTVKNLPVTWEIGVQSLGRRDPLEKELATPLQYSGLENPRDRGAWRARVQGGHKESDTTEQITHILLQ